MVFSYELWAESQPCPSRWYYFPRLRRDELLLFTCYDPSGRYVLHCAMCLPGSRRARESVEVRTIAFFKRVSAGGLSTMEVAILIHVEACWGGWKACLLSRAWLSRARVSISKLRTQIITQCINPSWNQILEDISAGRACRPLTAISVQKAP